MRLKRKCSTLITLLLILAGCVLRFAMPGHDYLGYLLWGVAVLVFLFPRLPRVGRAVLGVLVCAGLIVFTIFEIPVVRDARTPTRTPTRSSCSARASTAARRRCRCATGSTRRSPI